MIGFVTGFLTVVEKDHTIAWATKANPYWLCQCKCGRKRAFSERGLTGQMPRRVCSTKCPHYPDAVRAYELTRPLYRVWAGMKQRCFNSKAKEFKNYGGRGITVCDRWMKFAQFIEDMSPRPAGSSIDRIDVNGNYEPQNCRWATPSQQINNRRICIQYTYMGRTQTKKQWADEFGIPTMTMAYRLKQGYTIAEAIETPRGKHSKPTATHEGLTLSYAGWARRLGIPYVRVKSRMEKGWTIERMIREPEQVAFARNGGRGKGQKARRRVSVTEIFELDGKKNTVVGWSEEFKLPPKLVIARLRHHWGLKEALTTPRRVLNNRFDDAKR